MTHTTYSVEEIMGGPPGRTSSAAYRVYDLGEDVAIHWRGLVRFGRGFAEIPFGASAYGGVPDAQFRGYRVEVRLSRKNDGAAPWLLVRTAYVRQPWYVYREQDNRADAAAFGSGFQSQVRFDVFPATDRGQGAGASYVTAGGGVYPGCKIRQKLSCLVDVDLAGLADGDVLTWDAAAEEWVPGEAGGAEGALLAAANLSDVANAATARTNLGLGTAATLTSDTDTALAANSDSRVATQKAVKAYADAVAAAASAALSAAVAGLRWKQPVRVATTANGTLSSAYENGDTVDGVTLATGDRILLKNQTSGAENGIYTVNASGAPTRATDADASAELVSCAVYVEEGTANADKAFVCTNNAPITVGTTALVFVGFASTLGALLASNNLSDLGSVSSARTNLGLSGVEETLLLPFACNAASGVTLTNHAETGEFFANSNRNVFRIDLTGYDRVRISCRVTTASASANSPRLRVRYRTAFSTTLSNYSDIGTSEVAASLASTGHASSSKISLTAGAKADVWVTVEQIGGDGAEDPVVAAVAVEFFRTVQVAS